MGIEKPTVTEEKTKVVHFELNFKNIYTFIRDMTLLAAVIVAIYLYFSNHDKDVANVTYTETMNLFYDTYANETQLLNQQILRAREDKIRMQFERDMKERYHFSIFTPAERMKYGNTNG